MYKVFINNKEINFHHKRPEINSNEIIITDESIFDNFYNELETFKKSKEAKSLYIIGNNTNRLFVKFASFFTLVEAAGGIVQNEKNELLFIFRNGKWDLPKGKTDSGEKPDNAAIREVKEECGIKDLKIKGFVSHTYHIYHTRDESIVLKKTWWYEMFTLSTENLIPQEEEGITEVHWKNKQEISHALSNTYLSLKNLIENYLA